MPVLMLSIQMATYFFLILSKPISPSPLNGWPMTMLSNFSRIKRPPMIWLQSLVPFDSSAGESGVAHIRTVTSQVPARWWSSRCSLPISP